jgi:hypothetical protein
MNLDGRTNDSFCEKVVQPAPGMGFHLSSVVYQFASRGIM